VSRLISWTYVPESEGVKAKTSQAYDLFDRCVRGTHAENTLDLVQLVVPEFVLPFPAFVEILVVNAIELVQSAKDIFAGMRVNDVEKYRETHAMSGIDEFFQILGTSVTGASCKKAGDLVAKCWMCGQLYSFLSMLKTANVHAQYACSMTAMSLDGIVSEILYPGQNILRELFAGTYSGLRG
jgi:hypothetical protein